jgi:hypothetical protein
MMIVSSSKLILKLLEYTHQYHDKKKCFDSLPTVTDPIVVFKTQRFGSSKFNVCLLIKCLKWWITCSFVGVWDDNSYNWNDTIARPD